MHVNFTHIDFFCLTSTHHTSILLGPKLSRHMTCFSYGLGVAITGYGTQTFRSNSGMHCFVVWWFLHMICHGTCMNLVNCRQSKDKDTFLETFWITLKSMILIRRVLAMQFWHLCAWMRMCSVSQSWSGQTSLCVDTRCQSADSLWK